MMDICIRPMDANNRKTFFALAAEYLPDSDPAQMEQYAVAYPGAFLAAERQGQVIGVAFGWPRRFADPQDPSFELKGIAITWDDWRKGHGRRLLAAFEEAAVAYGAEYVSLGSAGGFVEKFYLACGYTPKEYKVWVSGVPQVEHAYTSLEDYCGYQRLNPDGFVAMEKRLEKHLPVNKGEYQLLRLLGKGKGGYSYLAQRDGERVVLKQIHHEPCDYYTFGNKIEAEMHDYQRLQAAGIRIPAMLDVDVARERIVKEYIEGSTAFQLVRNGAMEEGYLAQVREMAGQAQAAGLNIDYFPTNFIARDGLLWYIDYECNEYMEEWNFENWGVKYWTQTAEFQAYLDTHKEDC